MTICLLFEQFVKERTYLKAVSPKTIIFYNQAWRAFTFGRRLAIHGFINATLANGATIDVIVKDLPALGKLENAIDRYLNEPQALTQMRETFGQEEELPTIQQEETTGEDISVDDIPF